MMKKNLFAVCAALSLSSFAYQSDAVNRQTSVEPAAVFSDHAVLYRSAKTPIFGFAAPGARVRVTLGDVSAEDVANAQGRWLVRLDLSKAGSGPFELKMNDKTARDVLVGEVWLCSGQSNMSFKEGSADDAAVAEKRTDPMIRCFVVEGGAVLTPQTRASGSWLIARPGETHRMTAVGYQFARKLQAKLGGPIGLVEAATGAASLEAWCDPVSMAIDSEGKRAFDRQMAFMDGYRAYEKRCDDALRAWEGKWNRADRAHAGVPTKGWRALSEGERKNFGHRAGAIWLKCNLNLPAAGGVVSRRRFLEWRWTFDISSVEAYWNGQRIARAFPDDPIEKNTEIYRVNEGGAGELALRFFNAVRISDVASAFSLNGRRIKSDKWQFCEEFALPGLSAAARGELPERQRFCLRQHYPCGLYNSKIAPLVPMGLSGVIWYQGESNTTVIEGRSRAKEYEALFAGFIRSWRHLFERERLPFAWCQLAAYMGKAKDAQAASEWAELRASQTKTLALPATGQAVLIDAGEAGDIHPRDKRTPGARLAAWALNTVYGQRDIPSRGPHATSCRIAGREAVVTFADSGTGLVAKDLGATYVVRSRDNVTAPVSRNSPAAEVEGFAIAGADGRWVWADRAEIDGATVRVSSKAVSAPVAVRYAWADNPWVNLYNSAGLPAEPFDSQRIAK